MKSTFGRCLPKGTAIFGSPFLSWAQRFHDQVGTSVHSRLSLSTNIFAPAILAVSLLYAYLKTMAPGLTWANDGADGGDLIAASAVGGIPHPSGYPVYILLARAFQFLPIGTLAYRTNLMSAGFALLTALLVYYIVLRNSSEYLPSGRAQIAGLSAGYAIGLAPMFWSQAVITEVYTLHAFFVALILYLAVVPAEMKPTQFRMADRICGLVYGLASGNHLATLLVVPAAMFVRSIRHDPSRSWIDWAAVGRQFAWMLAGLLIYLILPMRAISPPVINWGDPVTLENFWWLVSGEIYRSYYLADTLTQMWPKAQATAALLLQQFGVYGVALILMELIVFIRASKLTVITGWLAVASLILALTYQSPDSFLYLIPFFISCSIWIGLFVGQALRRLSHYKPLWRWALLVALVINFSLGVNGSWSYVDASQDNRAESFGKKVFSSSPENAIVFVKGDHAVFAAWYFHYALGVRPDLTIVSTDLLHFDWYQETLRTTYPWLILTGPYPWPETVIMENPLLPVCYVEYAGQPIIDCGDARLDRPRWAMTSPPEWP